MIDDLIQDFLELQKAKKNLKKNHNQNENFRSIATKISSLYYDCFTKLIKMGIIATYSEGFRRGVELYLKDQADFLKKLK